MKRLEYFQRLADFGASLPGSAVETQDLDYFCEHIITAPDHVRSLLFGANVLRRQRLDARKRAWLQVLDVHPDLLSPLNDLRYEPSYTQLLGYFLAQHRSGLASDLLRSFLQALSISVDSADLSRVRVECEYVLPGDATGRVDLAVFMPLQVVYVENKVDSSQGSNQLARYFRALELEQGDRDGTLVYLTLPDHEAPLTSAPYKHLTFDDLLMAWLPFAAGTHPECAYLARFLKSIAILVGRAWHQTFEDWTFGTQRAALELVEEISVK